MVRACARRRESHRKRGWLQLVSSMTRLLLMLPSGEKIGREKNLFCPIIRHFHLSHLDLEVKYGHFFLLDKNHNKQFNAFCFQAQSATARISLSPLLFSLLRVDKKISFSFSLSCRREMAKKIKATGKWTDVPSKKGERNQIVHMTRNQRIGVAQQKKTFWVFWVLKRSDQTYVFSYVLVERSHIRAREERQAIYCLSL